MCRFSSLPAPPLGDLANASEKSPGSWQSANEGFAELSRFNHTDRFPGFIASLPLNNPQASVREIDRAVNKLGALGVQMFTNVERACAGRS